MMITSPQDVSNDTWLWKAYPSRRTVPGFTGTAVRVKRTTIVSVGKGAGYPATFY